jgi:hypothetical protein
MSWPKAYHTCDLSDVKRSKLWVARPVRAYHHRQRVLLTWRLIGRLKLNPFLSDGSHFISREQTLKLDVLNCVG